CSPSTAVRAAPLSSVTDRAQLVVRGAKREQDDQVREKPGVFATCADAPGNRSPESLSSWRRLAARDRLGDQAQPSRQAVLAVDQLADGRAGWGAWENARRCSRHPRYRIDEKSAAAELLPSDGCSIVDG